MLRLAGAAVALATALAVVATPVALADDGWGDAICDQAPVAGCDVSVGDGGEHGGGGGHLPGGGGGSGDGPDYSGCRWDKAEDYSEPGQPTTAGGWYLLTCLPDFQDGPFWVADAAPVPVSPRVLAETARSRLTLPVPLISASPAQNQLVRLPTWLWVDRAAWAPVTASASVPGVSVTATARPISLTWSMGDGTTVTCNGPGDPLVGGDPRAASPTCGHTYLRASERYPVTATIHWSVSWAGAGTGGTFPELTTSTTTAFRVVEIQALGAR
ncbi:hypothetical protein LV79_003801 [Actinokineospora globicatena]|nr:hypothetical protein [Actinokineospora globicatena]GLW78556.1 hypothetical protein Aglo01_30380 [Actinokineospora globicatena]GLW84780.1 hypothetical protein Aglo02_24200 [Actinokineospora globicatena]